MSLAVLNSRGLDGLDAPEVTVEVHLANGLPSFTLVGLADTEVKEARERVRAALSSSGLAFPHNRRVTVNLAPADLPKESGRFDLPIALGILAADGQIDAGKLPRYEFAGELSLAGDLRPIRGALAMALSLRHLGASRALVLPIESAHEAALVPDLPVVGAAHLLEIVAALQPGDAVPPLTPLAARTPPVQPRRLDLADVRGQNHAKRALEIAAAGGHSVLMVGPPGTGKSMLARRFVGLLPPLDQTEALESAAVLSLSGAFTIAHWGQRVLRTPHHSASSAALVGGGSPPRPGEISLAHHGVLFLDEPEFSRSALGALREPLETGCITISRAARQAEFPARFHLIAAMNPCACGYSGGTGNRSCRCTPDAISRYQARLSGPLLDRIDLQVEVPGVAPQVLATAPSGEHSAAVAARVAQAHALAIARQACSNAGLAGAALDLHAAPDPIALAFLQHTTSQLGWSARSFHRVLRVARTIADLAGHDGPTCKPHIAEAIQFRRVVGLG